MKAKALTSFKTKVFKPCKRLLQIFKFKFKKPIFIRPFPFHRRRKPNQRKRIRAFLSIFRSPGQREEERDEVGELRSMTDAGHERMLFPSPLTPAYLRSKMKVADQKDDVEDACRSFENYLVEMVVEEGKLRDLMDIEELLYCWKNLRCPVFIDLVCRFYGELCKDLFSAQDGDDEGEYIGDTQ